MSTEEPVEKSIEKAVEIVPAAALGLLNPQELDIQIATAHKFPRPPMRRIQEEILEWIGDDEETAADCFYVVKRGGEKIRGPSIRFAEIVEPSYGNIYCGARIKTYDRKFVVAEALAWDLEKNVRNILEAARPLCHKNEQPYSPDVQASTMNAAVAIARRNALFATIPNLIWKKIIKGIIETAVGKEEKFNERKEKTFARLRARGVSNERILRAVGKHSIDEITREDLEILIGLGTAIKDGAQTAEEAFPSSEEPNTEDAPKSKKSFRGKIGLEEKP